METTRSSATVLLSAACACLLAAGCGLGTGAAVSAGGGGNPGNAAVQLGAFEVTGTKESPATIRFVLTDPEGDGVEVELFFATAGGPLRSLGNLAGGMTSNPEVLRASPGGTAYEVRWSFVAEPGLPADGSFLAGITVFVSVNGDSQLTPGADTGTFGMGNDPPEVPLVDPPAADEVAGIADVRFLVTDSSADLVHVQVELNADAPDFPDGSWNLARPAGLFPGADTPEFAFSGVQAKSAADGGTPLVFFWDSLADLGTTEGEVRLRFRPVDLDQNGDPFAVGVAASTSFLVDNNEEPIVTLNDAALVANPDRIRGIPVPFEILDPEGDEVTLAFQWRRLGEEFPALPPTAAGIRAALADPEQRVALRIASPFPIELRGRLRPVDPLTVELTELSVEAAALLGRGAAGRGLELLRTGALAPLGAAALGLELSAPVAVLAVGTGETALVLDRPSTGSWRLREVRLTSGEVVRALATSPSGDPSALAFEPDRRSVLVASAAGGAWSLHRVTLGDTPAVVPLAVGRARPPAPIRGLAALGDGAAVATAGDALFLVQYGGLSAGTFTGADPTAGRVRLRNGIDNEAPRISVVADGLREPWGLVLHPTLPNRVFVAERGGNRGRGRALDPTGFDPLPVGRILEVRIDTHERRVMTFGEALPQRPSLLALDPGGTRLLGVFDEVLGDGEFELIGLDRGARGPISLPREVTVLREQVAGLSTGDAGLLLAALPEADDLLIAGGVQAVRGIEDFDPRSRRVSLEAPFEVEPIAGQAWRVESTDSIRPGPDGSTGSLVWDSAESGGGEIFLRAIPLDSEIGLGSESGVPKSVAGPLDTASIQSLADRSLIDLDVVDVEGDGDLDLLGASLVGDHRLFRQVEARSFVEVVLPGSSTISPTALRAVDLEGDGLPDVVSLRGPVGISEIHVHRQRRPLRFDVDPEILSDPVFLGGRALAVGDVDGDGLLDLVTANQTSRNLTVFLQAARGSFHPEPLDVPNTMNFVGQPDYKTVATADVDADGDLDLAAAFGLFIDNPIVFYQGPARRFEPVCLGTGIAGDDHYGIVFVDVDRDGNLDLVSANAQLSGASVYFQRRPRAFDLEPLVLGNALTTAFPRALAAADLTGDGLLELTTAGEGSLAVFVQDSPGVFQPVPNSFHDLVGGVSTRPGWLHAADLDGDGVLDLVAQDTAFQPLLLFGTRPHGFEETAVELSDPVAMERPVALVAADLDQDGDLDLATANDGTDSDDSRDNITIFSQLVPGSFSPLPREVRGALNPSFLHAADLDGDGDQDLLTSSFDGNVETLLLLRQEDSGAFGTPVRIGEGPFERLRDVAWGDVDADGDLDLVSVRADSFDLGLHLQAADGSFAPGPSIGAVRGLLSVVMTDLDVDGDLDVAAAQGTTSGPGIVARLQDGAGGFAPAPWEFPPFGGLSIVAGDVDADGLPDLLVLENAGSSARCFGFVQDGDGFPGRTFALDTLGQSVRSVGLRDLDRDGDLDAVVGSGHAWHQNRSTFFLPAPTPLAFQGDVGVAADLDGDGDVDVAGVRTNDALLGIVWGDR